MQNTISVEQNEKQKLTVALTLNDAVCTALCFFMSLATVFDGLTPFGIAFYAASFSYTGWTYGFIALVAGSLISRGDLSIIRYIMCAAIFTFINNITDKFTKTLPKAILTSSIFFIVSMAYITVRGFLLYDMVNAALETVLCFSAVYILDGAYPLTIAYKDRSFLSGAEMLSVVCLFSISILGLSKIPPVGGIKISNVASILLILMLNTEGEILTGAAIGVILGLIASIDTYNTSAVVGAYAFASLMSGLFKKFGKAGVIMGFVLANAVITAFLNTSAEVLINIYETIIASIIFLAVPKNFVNYFAEFPRKTMRSSVKTFSGKDRIQNMVHSKLCEMSNAFCAASQLIAVTNDDRTAGKNYIKQLIDSAAAVSCGECGGRFRCWQTNCKKTYSLMLNMFETAQSNGYISTGGVPEDLKKICGHIPDVVKSFNNMYSMYKTESIWRSRMAEFKNLTAQQLNEISKTLKKTAEHIDLYLDTALESVIRTHIDKAGCHPDEITVMSDNNNFFLCEVTFKQSAYRKGNEFKISKLISDATGRAVCYNDTVYENNYVTMLFYPRDAYSVSTGYAYIPKNGEKVCGDRVTVINEPNGIVMALSDGMGSGDEAADMSKCTCYMLEKYIKAGFSVETAVKMVNSSLILKSVSDKFATIDLCKINTNGGKIDLYKNGAAPTYIKTGDSVKKIECKSLPAGIIAHTDTDRVGITVDDSTLVVMISDGASVSNGDKNDWIVEELKKISTQNPQVIANMLLEKAKQLYHGKVGDDVTIAAAAVWKN